MTTPYDNTANPQSLLPMTANTFVYIDSALKQNAATPSQAKSMLAIVSADISDLAANTASAAQGILASNSIQSGSTYALEFPVYIPGTLLNKTYPYLLKMKHAGTITGFIQSSTSLITAGTYSITINGSAVTGLTSIANTTAVTETLATGNNSFSVGAVISIVIADTLTLIDLWGQLSINRSY